MCTFLEDEDGVEGKIYDCGDSTCVHSEKYKPGQNGSGPGQ